MSGNGENDVYQETRAHFGATVQEGLHTNRRSTVCFFFAFPHPTRMLMAVLFCETSSVCIEPVLFGMARGESDMAFFFSFLFSSLCLLVLACMDRASFFSVLS